MACCLGVGMYFLLSVEETVQEAYMSIFVVLMLYATLTILLRK